MVSPCGEHNYGVFMATIQKQLTSIDAIRYRAQIRVKEKPVILAAFQRRQTLPVGLFRQRPRLQVTGICPYQRPLITRSSRQCVTPSNAQYRTDVALDAAIETIRDGSSTNPNRFRHHVFLRHTVFSLRHTVFLLRFLCPR